MHKFQKFQDEVVEWSDKQFGDGDRLVPIINHLRKEVDELLETPNDPFEFADCFILLIEAARKSGMDMDTLLAFSQMKMSKNQTRVWGKPDENGIVEHIEEK